jgi:hypothetical protein
MLSKELFKKNDLKIFGTKIEIKIEVKKFSIVKNS